ITGLCPDLALIAGCGMTEFLQSAAFWKMRTCVLIFVSIIAENLLTFNQISFIAHQPMDTAFALRNF
ncbi:hypothetical protein, partial [Escherichia coli]|uniref:hypothetical protein n=1 Tax=Escherichia coli TaxID=562 RepID=UPI001BC82CA7